MNEQAKYPQRVLIVTGTMISVKDKSFVNVLKKQRESIKASSGIWLDIQSKIQIVETMISHLRYFNSWGFKSKPYAKTVKDYFSRSDNFDNPELTEVLLATLLEQAGIEFATVSFSELYANHKLRDQLLSECGCVFASSTLLRDFSELFPMMEMLKRPYNKVVIGGALTSMLYKDWPGCESVDLIAVGYGEYLVPALAEWIRNGYRELVIPKGGRAEEKEGTQILHSGLPSNKNLDHLVAPDWNLARQYTGKKLKMVAYESVRGCPYRCSFCNYPFLFDDNKFRYKSAQQIANDWEQLVKDGAEYITCLDSLFTMPKRRLVELCNEIISRGIEVRWICYARATDLCDLEVCELMKRAGCHQVQIGLESGSQQQLNNMNKRTTVEDNRQALKNCRLAGLTAVTTIILGFPGETPETIQETFELVKETPPDLYYAAVFNTRFEYVPILEKENADKFELVTLKGGKSSIPYWRHASMCSTETGYWFEWFNRKMAEEKVALNGNIFYSAFLHYSQKDRDALLDYQHDILTHSTWVSRFFMPFRNWIQRRLEKDVDRVFGRRPLLEAAKEV